MKGTVVYSPIGSLLQLGIMLFLAAILVVLVIIAKRLKEQNDMYGLMTRVLQAHSKDMDDNLERLKILTAAREIGPK